MFHRIHGYLRYGSFELLEAPGRKPEELDCFSNLFHCQAFIAWFAGQCPCTKYLPGACFSLSILIRVRCGYVGNTV